MDLSSERTGVAACQIRPEPGNVDWRAIRSGAAASLDGNAIDVAGAADIQAVSGWIRDLYDVVRAATPLSLRDRNQH